ncbi:glycosyltransferase family 9 protein [Marinobacter sp.]|uniref:glycosyltransferase family 9 protein n=1 Tax=Marinobacter sp. TaxID=50741 RepID=UPI003567740F
MTPVHSVCLLRLSAIGDTCNAAAIVQAIRNWYPEAQITWVIGKAEASLMDGMPGVNLVVFDKSRGLAAYRSLYRSLRGQRFDVLLVMQVALRASLASLCIAARRRIGFDRAKSKELHGLVVNERIEPTTAPHVLDNFRQFQKAIGVPLTPPLWDIPLSDDDRQWADAQLDQSRERHLIIIPAASNPERNWLPARYAAVADFASDQGFAVYLCGGPGEFEKALAKDIQGRTKAPIHNLVGQSSLKQLFSLIGQVQVVIAPDTGPAHMAVAAGTPVIGLYAHSNPARTGPYLWQDYVVDAYTPALQEIRGESPSQTRWGQRLKGKELMGRITTEQVCKTLQRCMRDQNL